MSAEDNSIRDHIAAAFDATEKAVETPPAAPAATEQVAPTEPAATAPATDSAPAATDEPKPEGGQPAEQSESAETAPTETAEESTAAEGIPPAPVSWRPSIREHWATLPAEVRNEVIRREREVNQVLQVSAQARQYAGEMAQTIQPYLPLIQAQGGTPVSAVGNLLQTAYLLNSAPASQKAELVAQMIRQYDVPVQALDQALSRALGSPAKPDDPAYQVRQEVRQELQQALAPMQQFMTAQHQAVQHAQMEAQRAAVQEVESLRTKPGFEYFDDVRVLMADLIDTASRNGRQMGLDEAYHAACLLHPEVKTVITTKQQRVQLQAQSAAAQRAKAAAVSVKPSPATGPSGKAKPTTLRGAIEAAFESASS